MRYRTIVTTGTELRDEGHAQLELAMGSAGEFWSTNARRFIENLEPGSLFDADLLRETCGTPPKAGAPGMLIRRAAFDGLLVEAGYRRSERPSRHAGLIQTWRRA